VITRADARQRAARLFVTGIVGGFNPVLAPAVFLVPTESAARIVADYLIESRGFYRVAKAVLATVVEELLFDGAGRTVPVEAGDAHRVITRLTSGVVDGAPPANGGTEAIPDAELEAQPDVAAAGG